MSKKQIIEGLIKEAKDVSGGEMFYKAFKQRVKSFIQVAYDKDELSKFNSITKVKAEDNFTSTYESHDKVIGYLQGLLVKLPEDDSKPNGKNVSFSEYDKSKVFVVHGRDTEIKETVARFIQKIGLKPIILHEQPNSGLTIIEKLESFSNVGFAVILLTPDDIGGLAADSNNLQSRARQNVILELGYFIGKLSRNRVCALYKKGVEIPSDYGSVVFIEFDEKGGWRTKLAQEFVHVGMQIEIEELLEA